MTKTQYEIQLYEKKIKLVDFHLRFKCNPNNMFHILSNFLDYNDKIDLLKKKDEREQLEMMISEVKPRIRSRM